MNILLIDDDRARANSLHGSLAEMGNSIAIARSAVAAFDLLAEKRFHLVLLHEELPDIDGVEILKKFRKIYNLLQLPVIVISDCSSEEFIITILESGANDCITRPFSKDLLKLKVRNLLQVQKTNAELEEKSAQFQAVFENSPVGISILNTRGEVELRNKAYQKHFGFEDVSDVHRPFGGSIHPEDLPRVQDLFTGLLSKRLNRVDEVVRIHWKDRGTVFFRTIASRFEDAKGKAGIVTVNEDITEKFEYERKLEELSEFNEIILNASPIGIATFDDNGDCVSVNRAAATIIGATVNDVLQQNYYSISSWKQSGLLDVVLRVREKGKSEEHDFEMDTTFGKHIWIASRIIRMAYHDEPHVMILFEDVTERKLAERALQESERQFRNVVETTTGLVVKLDAKGQIQYVNHMAKEILGVEAELCSGRSIIEFVHPDDRRFTHSALLDWLRSDRKNVRIENRVVSADGQSHTMEWNIHINRDPQGNVLDFTSVAVDVTRLRQAIATKDKFLSVLAHDLKNPFNGILMATEELAEDIELLTPDEIKTIAGGLHKYTADTYRFLINLLEWSRSQRDVIQFQPEKIQILELVRDIVQVFTPVAFRKGVSITMDVPADIKIYGDREMMKTVIRNLIDNAIKYTPSGGNVSVSARHVADHLEMVVSDNGKGMEEKTLKSLFKVGETRSTPGIEGEKGTGFGLLLCKEFVEKHGGIIMVDSIKDQGSRFLIQLPVQESSQSIA